MVVNVTVQKYTQPDWLTERNKIRQRLDLFINFENEISFNFQLIWQIDGWMTEQMNKQKKNPTETKKNSNATHY